MARFRPPWGGPSWAAIRPLRPARPSHVRSPRMPPQDPPRGPPEAQQDPPEVGARSGSRPPRRGRLDPLAGALGIPRPGACRCPDRRSTTRPPPGRRPWTARCGGPTTGAPPPSGREPVRIWPQTDGRAAQLDGRPSHQNDGLRLRALASPKGDTASRQSRAARPDRGHVSSDAPLLCPAVLRHGPCGPADQPGLNRPPHDNR